MKEKIVIIPEEVNNQLKELPKEIQKEINDAIDKLAKGEIVGELMDCEEITPLYCNKCGSENMEWALDKNSKEVYYRCPECNNHGYMRDWEYEETVEEHPEIVVKRRIKNGKKN